MEAFKIIKRIVSYLVFVVSASLFLKNSVSVALAYYIDPTKAFECSFLPAVYAILTMGITLLFQLLVIGKPKEVEKNIYPWVLIAPFAVIMFTSLFIVAKTIASCQSDPSFEPMYGVVGMVPAIALSLSEMVVGAMFLLENKKEEAPNKADEENQINLTKEE